jgi:hypothetical protein
MVRIRFGRLLLALLVVLVVAAPAAASPGDPIHSRDIIQDGLDFKWWYHYGNPNRGEVQGEAWVDVHWPCGDSTDEDGDCVVEDVRGHTKVTKIYRVARVQTNLTRLGRYPAHPADPAGTLAQNTTPRNSGTLPTVEHLSPWVTTQQFCGQNAFQTWTRLRFDVRWSDSRLSQGLTMLSQPTVDYISSLCGAEAMSLAERKALRAKLFNPATR